MKTIFITGGVLSSLGKGIVSACLGALLEARGFKVRLKKMDPYLNVDPGTMSPLQHGEVFVSEDGAETDLDLGHYERFTHVNCTKDDSISAGRIYWNVLKREREGGYLGKTIQIIPHITDEIKAFIPRGTTDEDFLICEIGGTVGDIEANPFLEAVRQYIQEKERSQVMVIHLTLLPYLSSSGELKTKPTQHSVRSLQSLGINPDLLLCRCSHPISLEEKHKLALFCNVHVNDVIAGYDAKSIYSIPLSYHQEGLDERVMKHFALEASLDLSLWKELERKMHHLSYTVKVGFVGKYTAFHDTYKSIIESFTHAGLQESIKVEIVWVDASECETTDLSHILCGVHGILVGPGFGHRGIEGKIRAVAYARKKEIPFLGICLGMQMAVIEASRHLLGLCDATSQEFGEKGTYVVGLMSEWKKEGQRRVGSSENLGGTMRLGAYECCLKENSRVKKIYNQSSIWERHRHRYEVNPSFKSDLESKGLFVSGVSADGELIEIVERHDHPWFIGVQFHPELKSRIFSPHPLFVSFLRACLAYSQKHSLSAN